IIIRAVDSSAFDVQSEDAEALARQKRHFRNVTQFGCVAPPPPQPASKPGKSVSEKERRLRNAIPGIPEARLPSVVRARTGDRSLEHAGIGDTVRTPEGNGKGDDPLKVPSRPLEATRAAHDRKGP